MGGEDVTSHFSLRKLSEKVNNATVLHCLLRNGRDDKLEGQTDYSLNNSANQTKPESYKSIHCRHLHNKGKGRRWLVKDRTRTV